MEPLLEEKPYVVVIAGVRHPARTEAEALAVATRQEEEWAALGYRRRARVFYRDGREVPR